MDYICRKLRLQRGETVIEAGCGWGALALHMARHYGVRVKAFNISREQLRHARERAREENLDHLVEFIEDDYRNASGKFDAFVSVGMLEHVGRENYSQLGSVIHRLIGDGGRGLLHFIGRREPGEFSRWIRKRIFPGAHAPTLREAMQVLEPFGYFVRDVEDLRSHYAKTLEHWLEQFDKASEKVIAMYGAEFERAWRLYLAGSIAGFTAGTLQLFQIVFSGAEFESMPWTRADLYGGQGEERMDSCDILIVGGGPAGSSCAWGLRNSGLDVAIIDKQRFPRDKVCGGWITPPVLKALKMDPVAYGAGRTLQPITSFRMGSIGTARLSIRITESRLVMGFGAVNSTSICCDAAGRGCRRVSVSRALSAMVMVGLLMATCGRVWWWALVDTSARWLATSVRKRWSKAGAPRWSRKKPNLRWTSASRPIARCAGLLPNCIFALT